MCILLEYSTYIRMDCRTDDVWGVYSIVILMTISWFRDGC